MKVIKKLESLNTEIIEHSSIKSILNSLGYKKINDKISSLIKNNILIKLKKGLYIYNSPINNKIVSKELIANILFGPSYISFDYALYFHNLIPEFVHNITSATIKHNKIFNTQFGIFKYKHISKELYNNGVEIVNINNKNILMASKEKALVDKILSLKGLRISSVKQMKVLLEDDLRIDIDELISCETQIIQDCLNITKSTRLKFLLAYLEKFQ